MKIRIFSILAAAMLAGCGGGSVDGDSGGESTPAVSYKFVPPTLGQFQTYTRVMTDVAGNSGSFTYTDTVTQTNSDRSYSVSEILSDGGATQVALDGVYYEFYPLNYEYDDKGQLIESNILSTPPDDVCHYTYPQGGAPSTVPQGQSWNANQAVYCDGIYQSTNIETTTFIGMESVTVAAGTFSTYKFQNVETITNPTSSVITTNTTTTWLNASPTDSSTVKAVSTTSVTGRIPAAGELQSVNWELISYK